MSNILTKETLNIITEWAMTNLAAKRVRCLGKKISYDSSEIDLESRIDLEIVPRKMKIGMEIIGQQLESQLKEDGYNIRVHVRSPQELDTSDSMWDTLVRSGRHVIITLFNLPNDPVELRKHAHNLANSGNYNSAFEILEECIKLSPNNHDLYYDYGLFLEQQGDFEGAIKKLKHAIELKPDFSFAYYEWGIVLRRMKDLDHAIDKFKRAIELDPHHAQAYQNWGGILYQQENYNDAFLKFSKAVELCEDYVEAYFSWANALRDNGDHNEANIKYDIATKLKPNWAELYYNWALNFMIQGDHNRAREKFNTAIGIKPELKDVFQKHSSMFEWDLIL